MSDENHRNRNTLERRLVSLKDVNDFANSSTGGQKLLKYLQEIGRAIHGERIVRVSSDEMKTPYLKAFSELLKSIYEIAESVTPYSPSQCEQRYGNPAFRIFIKSLEDRAEEMTEKHFGESGISLSPARVSELGVYIKQSFGNQTRIDYGSGHELNFIAATLVANEAVYWKDDDGRRPRDASELTIDKAVGQETVGGVYLPYLELARYLQSRYRLEPAGSRGAWGLDDYQFIGFLLGSYQIKDDDYKSPKPSDSASKTVASELKSSFLYFNMINHIMATKGEFAPFHLVSPMLFDISKVATWEKIASGFEKMFQNEILKAYPIMQHFQYNSSTFL